MDSTGNVNWARTYGGSNIDAGNGIFRTSDGGYFLSNNTQSFGSGNYDFFPVRIDSLGNVIWASVFGGTGNDVMLSATQDGKGNFNISGRTGSFGLGGLDATLLKVDSSGQGNCNMTNINLTSQARSISANTPSTVDSVWAPDTASVYYTLTANTREFELCDINAAFIYNGDTCLGFATQFTDQTFDSSFANYTLQWNFDDPLSGSNNTSTLENPAHQFTHSDTFLVTLITSNGYVSDTATRKIYIKAPFLNVWNEDATICKGDSFQLNIQTTADTITWTPGNSLNDSTIKNPYAQPFSTTFYQLTVTDTMGCQNYDTVQATVKPNIKLPAPKLTRVEVLNDSVIQLRWDTPSVTTEFLRYRVYRRKAFSAAFSLLDTLYTLTDTMWTDSSALQNDSAKGKYTQFSTTTDTFYNGINCGSPGSFRIKYKDGGRTVISNTTAPQFQDTTSPQPSEPEIVSTRYDILSNSYFNEIRHGLSSSPDVKKYEVYYSDGGNYQLYKSTTYPAGKVTLQQSGVSPESKRYCYYVTTHDSCGNYSYSDTHCVVQLFTTPHNLSAELNWHPYQGWTTDRYFIQQKQKSLWKTIDSVSGTDTNYSATGLKCNKPYKFRVLAVKQALVPDSSYSNQSKVIPFDTINPPEVNLLNVTVIDSNRIGIYFDTVPDQDVDSYRIYVSKNGGSFNVLTTITDPQVMPVNYIHSNINTLLNRYCYKVYAIDSCNDNISELTEIHCAMELDGSQANLSNELHWYSYSGFNIGKYYINRSQGNGWQVIDSVSGLDTSYLDTPLACNVKYSYKIEAKEAGGDHRIFHSDSLSLTPFDTISPVTPLMHFTSVLNDSTIKLSWEPSSLDVNRYVIYRKNKSGVFQSIDTTRPDTFYFDRFSNKISKSHCYRIRAVDSCSGNQSGLSPEHCTIKLKTDTSRCKQKIELTWNDYQGWPVDTFEIYRSVDSGKEQLLAKIPGDTTSFTDHDVKYYQKYCYRIKALGFNAPYESYSQQSCSKVFFPQVPKVLYATKLNTSKVNGKVKVKWKSQQGGQFLSFQRLYYRFSDSNSFILLKDGIPLSQDSFVHSKLNTKVKDHAYYLTTVDFCGNESDSLTIHKTMDLEFTVGQLLHKLNWTPYRGFAIQNYYVQQKKGGIWTNLDTVPPGDTSLRKFPAPCNFDIIYRIKAVDSFGNFSISDTSINRAIDTIPPDGATMTNLTLVKDSIVKLKFTGADSLDIFAFDIRKARIGKPYRSRGLVMFSTPGKPYTIYDTTNTHSYRQCYTVTTLDSCLNAVPSDTFCLVQLRGNPENLANQLNWHPFKGYPVDSYEVLIHRDSTWKGLVKLPGTDTSYFHQPLSCNVPRIYKILTTEKGGTRQSYSDSLRLIPFDTIDPPAPDVKKATVMNSDSVRIKYDTVNAVDVDRYEIFYSKNGSKYKSLGIIPKQHRQPNQFTHTGIDPVQNKYCYYVIAIDSCSDNRSVPSDTHWS